MKRFAFALVLFLLLPGCTPRQTTENLTPTFGPILSLHDGSGVEIPGSRGSYCHSSGCVDTIGFLEMFNDSGMDFYPVAADSVLTLEVDSAISEFTVDFYNETGDILRCSAQPTQVDETHLRLTPCLDGNNIFMDVFIRYQKAGDVSYYYPLRDDKTEPLPSP